MKESISLATEQDAELLSVLINSAYRGDSSRKGWTTEADLIDGTRTDPELILDLLRKDGCRLLKFVGDAKILGCVELQQSDEKLYIGMLTVDPDHQGKGIGKMLLRKAEEEALASGCRSVYMTVLSERNELIDWYVRHGYVDTGERKPFAFSDPRFGRPRRALEFSVLEKVISSSIENVEP